MIKQLEAANLPSSSPISASQVSQTEEVKKPSKVIGISIVPQEKLNLTPEESLIKAIKEHDVESLNAKFENKALFTSIFTKDNYNLTMLVLDQGSKETFDYYMKYLGERNRKIKFVQKNTVTCITILERRKLLCVCH